MRRWLRLQTTTDVLIRFGLDLGLAVFVLDIRLDFVAASDLWVVDIRPVRKRGFVPSASASAERKFCGLRRWVESRGSPAQVQREFWALP